MYDLIKKYSLSYKFYSTLLLVFGLFTTLSLITYNNNDPSSNVITTKYPSNFFSYYGAYYADLLYQAFGISSFILPLCFFCWAILLLVHHNLNWIYLRLVFITGSIIAFSIYLAKFPTSVKLPASYSGVVGNYLYPILIYYTGTPAVAWILFVALILLVVGLGVTADLYLSAFKFINNLLSKGNLSNQIKLSTTPSRITKPPIFAASTNPIAAPRKIEINKNIPPINPEQPAKALVKSLPQLNNNYLIPDIDLLRLPDKHIIKSETNEQLAQNATDLIKVLNDFGVKGDIVEVNQGPVVTQYEFEPAAGTKSSRVIGLADDIARSLSAISTRISVISGRNVLGVELPNKERAFFCLRELIQTPEYQNPNLILPLILGKDLAGKPFVADLAKMPHLLVAGTTGSGKSVAINTMIMSLLYRYSPDECKLIMIDPKMLELSIYDGIPHLLTPVVTEAPKAITALKWAVKEMENRYKVMSNVGVRNIAGFNAKITEALNQSKTLERTVHTGFDHETGKAVYETIPLTLEKLPLIVIIVDEMADLMIVAGKDIEASIQRLAQMARAAGIHIIMATQRPSVDVITGVIKANFPSRISFKVTSKIDSRTILGEPGADQLLGMGDMLYMGNSAKITRVHGPFVTDNEVEKVTTYLKSCGVPQYIGAITENAEEASELEDIDDGTDDISLYKKAVHIVNTERKVSISYIQRCLRIGYNRAATIIERMEQEGIISSPSHSGKREILLPEN